jgi:iron(III) transport system ATP-binding protein
VTISPANDGQERARPTRTAAPAVRVTGLSKSYATVKALDGIDLEVARGETLAILGPSGCGKTTLLRAIAGLERPDDGTVEIAGRLVDGGGAFVPPERRRVGMVFQDVALFPHLTVAQNVAYGLARATAGVRDARVAELLALVGLTDAGSLRPHQLSGGMAQRVALARALAPRPDIVLLDEPFASLDMSLRTQLRGEVRRVLEASGATGVFVTHDQAEALTLADRVAVMRRGRIDQVASPERIYAEPQTAFVATFVGIANLLPGTVESGIARIILGAIRVPPTTPNGHVLVVIRPEHADLAPQDDTAPGRGRPGTIVGRRFAGSELLFEVVLDGDSQRLWVEAGPQARRLTLGDAVSVALRADETVAFSTRVYGDGAGGRPTIIENTHSRPGSRGSNPLRSA